jgi:hypothetical protein
MNTDEHGFLTQRNEDEKTKMARLRLCALATQHAFGFWDVHWTWIIFWPQINPDETQIFT